MKKRSFDRFHCIDDEPMLNPDVDVEVTYEDQESASSGFDESGFYHRCIVRYDKRTWRFKYSYLTEEEFIYLRNLVKGKNEFTFSFVNECKETEHIKAYAKPLSVVYRSRHSGLYKNLTIEIIEC